MPHRKSSKKPVSREKAKKILRDKEVRGKPLTEKQKGLFGVIASGRKPRAPVKRRVR